MNCNPVQFILWLIILIFISFIVGFFCAPLYVIVHCLSGFVPPLSNGAGELIFYQRPDTRGPKLSTYKKTDVNEANCRGLCAVLADSNGILGIVQKTRYLYLVGQSRIHIDDVLNLGVFAEIEVVLTDDQTTEDAQEIMTNLMEKLGIKTDHLIATAYLDMILTNTQSITI